MGRIVFSFALHEFLVNKGSHKSFIDYRVAFVASTSNVLTHNLSYKVKVPLPPIHPLFSATSFHSPLLPRTYKGGITSRLYTNPKLGWCLAVLSPRIYKQITPIMKTFLLSALLAASAAALPQGLGQISRIVIVDGQPTAIAVPRNAEPQHLGPVSRTVIHDSQPTVLTVPRNAEPQHLGPVSRTVIYDSQPTVLAVPRDDVADVAKRQSIGGICMIPYSRCHLPMCHFGACFADHNRLQQRLVCVGILLQPPRRRLQRVPP